MYYLEKDGNLTLSYWCAALANGEEKGPVLGTGCADTGGAAPGLWYK